MGVGTILDSAEIILMATGEHKAPIVRAAVEEPPTNSMVWACPNSTPPKHTSRRAKCRDRGDPRCRMTMAPSTRWTRADLQGPNDPLRSVAVRV